MDGRAEALATLARSQERVFSVDELLDAVWPGLIVTPNSLHQANAALELDDSGAALAHAQRGMAVNAEFATLYVAAAVAAWRLGDRDLASTYVRHLVNATAFSSIAAAGCPAGPAAVARFPVARQARWRDTAQSRHYVADDQNPFPRRAGSHLG